jgi:hypothetical protein
MRRFILIAIATALTSVAAISTSYARGTEAHQTGAGNMVWKMRVVCRTMVRATFCGGARCPPPGRHADVERCVQNGGRLE